MKSCSGADMLLSHHGCVRLQSPIESVEFCCGDCSSKSVQKHAAKPNARFVPNQHPHLVGKIARSESHARLVLSRHTHLTQ